MARGAGAGPGIADRFRQRLRVLGYWDESKNRPQRMRFADDHGYELVYVMSWLDGKQPSWDNLYRLAADLSGPDRRVTPAWLLFGEDGGLQLVKSSMSTPAVAKSRRKRARAAKIVGAVALFGASL